MKSIGKYLFSTLALCLTISAAASQSQAAEYAVDASHSRVGFKVKHLGISNVNGLFKEFTGSITFDEKDIASTKCEASIVVKSIDTDVKKRDDHLTSADFFDADKHSTISFTSTAIKDVNGKEFTIVGDLTIRGTTKQVELKTEYTGAAKDPWGNERIAFEASSKINRKDFGMTWSKLLETGGLVVGEDVKIELEIEAIKKK